MDKETEEYKQAIQEMKQIELDASKCQKSWDKIDQEFGGNLNNTDEYYQWSSWDLAGSYSKETDPFYRSTIKDLL